MELVNVEVQLSDLVLSHSGILPCWGLCDNDAMRVEVANVKIMT